MYSTSELIGLIQDAALRYGIDPNIAVAQLDRESVHFRSHYVYGPGRSPAGAQGLAQFMPGTWAMYGVGSPYDPVAALEAWGRYMSHLLSVFGGRYDLALAGYNWGENRSALRQALSTGQSILSYSIPSETRNYVAAILNAAPSPIVSINVVPDVVSSSDFYSDSASPTPYALPPVESNTSLGSVVPVVIIALVGVLLLDLLLDSLAG